MPERELLDSEVISALQRIGVAGVTQLHDELDHFALREVEESVSRLESEGRIDRLSGVGRFYRVRRLPIDWDKIKGKVTVVHNDPVDVLADVQSAFNLHVGVEHVGLESTVSALVGEAESTLQIVSPYMDVRSVERFAPEFARAFSRHVEFTYVGRGILRREDLAQGYQYAEKIAALQRLWEVYNAHNPGDPTRFSLRDYLRYDAIREERLGGLGGLTAAVHQKIIVQDRRRAYMGSGEFRNNSFGATGEVGVLLDGDQASLLGDIVQCYARKGTPVDPLTLDDLLTGTPE